MPQMEIDYILCHGSGNRFVLADAVAEAGAFDGVEMGHFARAVCSQAAFGTDGLLLLVGDGAHYAMRMFNPDGSEAGMCGNGIRCVARLAERYLPSSRVSLRAGGNNYRLQRQEPIFGDLPTYSVAIPDLPSSSDFPAGGPEPFIGRSIPALSGDVRFTYLYPGNPHLVAFVDRIELEQLVAFGKRITELEREFPRGANVSLCRTAGPQRIFVATYERGAGLTSSCGTAMTASSTAACLLGACRWEEPVEVLNRGGMVRCLCSRRNGHWTTTLTGNATFEQRGRLRYEPATQRVTVLGREECTEERAMYARFAEAVASKNETD